MSPTFQKNDLMSVLESIADAVVKLDGRANYTAMNQAAAEIFRRLGRDPEQVSLFTRSDSDLSRRDKPENFLAVGAQWWARNRANMREHSTRTL